MRIVIAPDKFKEALSAREAAAAIARGVRRVRPDARLDLVPMADGGEGTVEALAASTGGRLRTTRVAGPLGQPVEACWGLTGDASAAIIEMSAASGLALVALQRRDPTQTSTFGTGELLAAALEAGVRKIVIGIGGSATNDGGTGAAQALGVEFIAADGRPIHAPMNGGRLLEIARIDVSRRDPRLPAAGGAVEIEVACDVRNPLIGPTGAAAVYGPQKGATPERVELLDRGLAHLADLMARDLGREVRWTKGAGAAGGLGAGLMAFCGGVLRPGIEIVMQAVRLSERLRGTDLVLTGEGRLDRQSMMGKVIAGVAQTARSAGVPVVALVGQAGEGADDILSLIESYHLIGRPDRPLAEALARTAEDLEMTAAKVVSDLPR